MRVHKRHGVLEIQVGFAIEGETLIGGLDSGTVDKIGGGGALDLVCREIGEEEIEVALKEGLRRVLDDTEDPPISTIVHSMVDFDLPKAILRIGGEIRRKPVQCTQAVRDNELVAILQFSKDIVDVDLGSLLR